MTMSEGLNDGEAGEPGINDRCMATIVSASLTGLRCSEGAPSILVMLVP